jgi:periplasmic protein CpxP/Spy
MKKLGKIQTLAVASLAAIGLATPFALAQVAKHDQGGQHEARGEWRERGEHDGPGGGGLHGGMFKQLNLTDAQKAQMKQLHQSFAEQTKPLREQLRAKHEELRQAEQGGTFDEAAATQKLTEAAGLEAKLMGAEFKLRQDMLAVLTPEQKTQLEQARAQFKANHAERHERQDQ